MAISLDPSSNLHPAQPVNLQELEDLQDLKQTNDNLGLLFVGLQFTIEEAKDKLIHGKLDEIDQIQHKQRQIHELLNRIETQLANNDVKQIIIEDQKLVEEIAKLIPHDLLQKAASGLSKPEAEAVCKALSRQSQHYSSAYPIKYHDVQRELDKRHEMYKSLKQMFESWDRMLQNMVRGLQKQ